MPKEPIEAALRLLWLLCLTGIAPLFGQTLQVSNIASSSGTNPGANATTQVVSRMITEFLGN